MKLRLRDNSLRLRLTQGEVEQIRTAGLVRGRTRFPGGNSFDYILESSPASVQPEAHMSGSVLTVRVPQEVIVRWAESGEVSISSAQMLGDGEKLAILVEKDFACLAPREGEDETDMFPHPRAGAEQC